MHCLSALFSEHPPSVKRLSELISVNPTRTSRLLKYLEEKGFVVRSLDASDHRKELVVLTDSGTKAVQAILSLFAEVGSELLFKWKKGFAEEFSWISQAVESVKQESVDE